MDEAVKEVSIFYYFSRSVEIVEIPPKTPFAKIKKEIRKAIKDGNKTTLGEVDDRSIEIKITEDFYSFIKQKTNSIIEEDDKLTVSSEVQAKVISDLQDSFLLANPENKKKRCLQVEILPAAQQQQDPQIQQQQQYALDFNLLSAKIEALKLEQFESFSKLEKKLPHNENEDNPPSKTRNTLGKEILKLVTPKNFTGVKDAEVMFDNPKKFDGAPESSIISQVRQRLQQLLENKGMIVVDSQNYAWIRVIENDPKNNLKPDLLICHPVLFKPSNDKKTNHNKKNYFGTLVDWSLKDKIAGVVEGKTEDFYEGIGQLVLYHFYLNLHCKNSIQRGMVLTRTNFYLLTSVGQTVVSIEESEYTTPGSADLIVNHFYPPKNFAKEFNCLCLKLNVEAIFPPRNDQETSSFLGRGGFGTVFKVAKKQDLKSQSREFYALKMIQTINEHEFRSEIGVLSEISKLNDTPPVVELIGHAKEEAYFGLTVSPVGVPVSISTKEERKEIFLALLALHLKHGPHGDARRSNAIKSPSGMILWIDLLNSNTPAKSFGIFIDVKSLIHSVYHQQPSQNLFTKIEDYAQAAEIGNAEEAKKLLLEIIESFDPNIFE